MMPSVVSSTQFNTMTIGDEAEIRRTSVGTKVLMVGLAVLAVLGSFWSIVWFIRSYVEAPRISMAPMALAARESAPVTPTPVTPTPVRSVTITPAKAQPAADPPAAPAPVTAEAAPRAADAINDRWMPMTPPPAPEPAPVAPPETSVPAALASPAETDPPVDEVAESSIPAISGAAPLPRRKPTQTAAVRPRSSDPPLPRPRPDGPAPQSVWTAVPTTDDRFPPQ
jgi:fused signal recognition particle receptor